MSSHSSKSDLNRSLSKRSSLRRKVSMSSRSESKRLDNDEGSSKVKPDQITNPDTFNLKETTYLGTNKHGVVTGFKQITPPTLIDMPSKYGGGMMTVAKDSGIMRRYETRSSLIDSSDDMHPKNKQAFIRPMQHYIDGTATSMFDRAVTCWPNLKFYGTRVWNSNDKKMEREFSWRTLEDADSYATALAKGLVGYGLVNRHTFTDEEYLPAKTLQCLTVMIANREEFHIVEQAVNKVNATMVPVYPSLGADACKAIFNEVQATALVTDIKTLGKLAGDNSSKSVGIDTVILVDSKEADPTKRDLSYLLEGSPAYEELRDIMRKLHITNLIRFSNLIELGDKITDGTDYSSYQSQRVRPVRKPISAPYVNPGFAPAEDGIKLYNESPFASAFQKAPCNSVRFEEAKTEDVQTICYTSGTTGMPKGVLVTHRNLAAVAIGGMRGVFQTNPAGDMEFGLLEAGPHVTESPDMTYEVLPLVHVFERLIVGFNYIMGIQLAMFSQDPTQLTEEMQITQPTIFSGVPRIFQKIISAVEEQVEASSYVAKTIFNTAVASKAFYAERDGTHHHAMYDTLVFNKIKNKVVGPRLKLILTGAAPLSASLQYKCEALFNTTVIEGYGLSESTGAVCVRLNGDAKGSVGAVMPSVEIKLEHVPEMDLADVRDQMKGEICIRGNSVTPGYFRRPDINREAFDEEGWFHTGDVGQIQGGLLSIRDRKKAIFKLAQGEYISPERVEGFILTALPWVEQIIVTGRSTSRFACAIASLVPSRVPGWEKPVTENSDPKLKAEWEKFLADNKEEIRKRFVAEQRDHMKVYDIQGYERVDNVEVLPYILTDERFVTPTSKIKRIAVNLHYKETIERLCDEIDGISPK